MRKLGVYFFDGTVDEFYQMSKKTFNSKFGPDCVQALCPLDDHVLIVSGDIVSGNHYSCECCGTLYDSLDRNSLIETARSRAVELRNTNLRLIRQIASLSLKVESNLELFEEAFKRGLVDLSMCNSDPFNSLEKVVGNNVSSV